MCACFFLHVMLVCIYMLHARAFVCDVFVRYRVVCIAFMVFYWYVSIFMVILHVRCMQHARN